jgi:hypothetical protein
MTGHRITHHAQPKKCDLCQFLFSRLFDPDGAFRRGSFLARVGQPARKNSSTGARPVRPSYPLAARAGWIASTGRSASSGVNFAAIWRQIVYRHPHRSNLIVLRVVLRGGQLGGMVK